MAGLRGYELYSYDLHALIAGDRSGEKAETGDFGHTCPVPLFTFWALRVADLNHLRLSDNRPV